MKKFMMIWIGELLSGIGMIIAACTAGRNKKLRAIQVEGRQASVS